MAEDDTTVLDDADAPVLQVVLSGSPRAAWEDSQRGLSPADLAMNVVLPELDGRLLTRAISFKSETPADPRLEFAGVRHEPAADRVDYVARLAAAWARLRPHAAPRAASGARAVGLSGARRAHRLCRRPRHRGERRRDPESARAPKATTPADATGRPPTSSAC